MEKQAPEELASLLKEVNKHLEHISYRLDGIDKSLERMADAAKKKRKPLLDI